MDKLWAKLGIGKILNKLLKSRKYSASVERAIFAMVANRALNPVSKLAVERWVNEEVYIDNLPEVEDGTSTGPWIFLYSSRWPNVFNLEVDLIYLTPPPPTLRRNPVKKILSESRVKQRPPSRSSPGHRAGGTRDGIPHAAGASR